MARGMQVYIEYLNRGLETVQGGLGAVDAGLRKIGAQADVLDAKLRRVDQTLAGWQRTGALLAGAGIGGLGILMQQGLGVHSMFEDIHAAFETMLKDTEKADKLMQEVVKFTAATPFQLADVAASAQGLLSWGEAAEDVTNRLQIMGDVAAIKKVPLLDVINALEKLRTTGHWESEQLVRAGITSQSLEGYIDIDPTTGLPKGTGAEKFAAAMQFLEDFYGGGMQKVMNKLSGLISNFKDKIVLGLDVIGDAIDEKAKNWLTRMNARLDEILNSDRLKSALGDAFLAVVEQAEPYVEQLFSWLDRIIDYLQQNPQALVNGMRQFLAVLKNVTAAVLALTAARGLIALITALTTIAGIFGGGGIGGVIAFVGGGAGLIWLFNKFKDLLSGTSDVLPGLTGGLGDLAGSADDAASNMGGFNDTLGWISEKIDPLVTQLSALYKQLENIANLEVGDGTLLSWLAGTLGDNIKTALAEVTGLLAMGSGEKLTLDSGESVNLNEFNKLVFNRRGLAPWNQDNLTFDGQQVTASGIGSSLSFAEALGLQLQQVEADRIQRQSDLQARDDLLYQGEAHRLDLGITSGVGGLRRAEEVQQLTQKTQGMIKGLPANKICVIKTRDGFWLMSGEDPAAKPIFDAFTASVQTSIPALEAQGMQRTSQPVAGDIVFLDRMDGTNTAAGGHAGIFYGYDEQGRPIVSGNKAGSLYPLESKWGSEFSLDPYTNQQGLFAFANPFSPVRAGTGYAGNFALSPDGTAASPFDALSGGMDAANQAAQDLQEKRNKQAEQLVATTEEQLRKLRANLDLATKQERAQIEQQILDTQANAFKQAYVADLQRLIDSNVLSEWMQSFIAGRAASDALNTALERQTALLDDMNAIDEESQARIRKLRIEAGKQGLSPRDIEGDVIAQELYALQEQRRRIGLEMATEADPARRAELERQINELADRALQIADSLASLGDNATSSASMLRELAYAAADAAGKIALLVDEIAATADSIASQATANAERIAELEGGKPPADGSTETDASNATKARGWDWPKPSEVIGRDSIVADRNRYNGLVLDEQGNIGFTDTECGPDG